jgi:ATP-dependent helicase/nuclease subunit A
LEQASSRPTRPQIAASLEQVLKADQQWDYGAKGRFRDPHNKFFEDAQFLRSVACRTCPSPHTTVSDQQTASADPLAEDWQWVRPQMIALLQLAQQFGAQFARAKRELGAVDFHDLEQFALQLLWDRQARQPTTVAQHWRERLRLLFVDEYQDINAAQDAILQALGRAGAEANRFLVGDVKQSIYRFRLADPRIFQRYALAWSSSPDLGAVIDLADNFRSHEAILEFVNAFFSRLMRPEIGGVAYDEKARLRFGDATGRRAMTRAAEEPGGPNSGTRARIELLLRLTGVGGAENDSGDSIGLAEDQALSDLSKTEQEARLLALRLKELKEQPAHVWDQEKQQHRPVQWRDMVILLRSPRYKAESYAKEFARLGLPLVVARSGFYDATEITDWLSLLQLLDNPLQDIPLLAVLRSPVVGISLDELAIIRHAHRDGYFWTALNRFQQDPQPITSNPKTPDADACSSTAENANANNHTQTLGKVELFLQRYARWRQFARQGALSRCLETMLDETCYEAWLLGQPRGDQRQANVRRLLTLTQQFDQFQRQGLFRFLRFVEAQQAAEVDAEPALISTENAVQLLSIHQSKGLEFPVVAVADLGKPFNFSDLYQQVILDEELGLCPQVKPPHTGQRYPSLPYWLAQRRQKRELLGEEMRLLYVAMTRACDMLLLAGTAAQKTTAKTWPAMAAQWSAPQLLTARCYLDWLGGWLVEATGHRDWTGGGQTPLLEWRVYLDAHPGLAQVEPSQSAPAQSLVEGGPAPPQALQSLQQRLAWQYPFAPATRQPAKSSVSALRRQAVAETEEESPALFDFSVPAAKFRIQGLATGAGPELSPAEIGTAHHAFLELVALERVNSRAELEREADRLERMRLLLPAERQALDLDAVAGFWQSDIGQRIRARADQVRRELPFTARFRPMELGGLLSPSFSDPSLAGEFIVVQGVADLAVVLEKEVWLLDYKTDRVTMAEVDSKIAAYKPQIRLYAMALSQIYHRPVTQRWLHFLALNKSVAIGD